MIKLASAALTTVLGVSGIACAAPANADPYFRAEVVSPRLVVEPWAYAPGFYSRYFAHAPYGRRRDYDRGGYERYRGAFGWDRHGYRR